MELNFQFTLGEEVYNKPGTNQGGSLLGPALVQYIVVSRLYEEIGTAGNGVISYIVRHVEATSPGGGKMYKFAQDELISKAGYDSFLSLKKQTQDSSPSIKAVYPPAHGLSLPGNYYGQITNNTGP